MNAYRELNDRIARLADRTPTPAPLARRDLARDPLEQFARWLADALDDAQDPQPNAACRATAGPDGARSA